ncbi:MAG: polyprenyl synthetase family protein [Nitrospirae bacterium]|nr:polyprenyl synthetase family protein [Nitrospirota bacterium]
MELKVYLKQKQRIVDGFLKEYLSALKSNPPQASRLYKAMGYSLLAGGKRLRPILAIASYEAAGGRSKSILPVAASLELIHTYSLIHDDLPAMDDDNFRRNKPTSHRVFGEGMAILAGDALLTEAFGIISNSPAKSDILIKIIVELTQACGADGMVGGQAADILLEGKRIKEKDLLYIHTHKTGALIKASVRIGALMAAAPPSVLNSLTKYGTNIGLAFQIIDDILDIIGTQEELGKSPGADTARGKNTYPSVYGMEESIRKAEQLVEESLEALKGFGAKAEPLREIATYLLKRRN